MNHRHLLPNEIDLLVDGESGFGVTPLRAHVAECDDCRTRFEALRELTGTIETLPHFTPNIRFSDRVMKQVQVIEPWHVAVTDTVRRVVPSNGPMRVAAGAGVAAVGLLVSSGAVWLAFRADLATWVLNVAVDSSRRALLAGAGEVAAQALGTDGAAALTSGGPPVLALSAAVLAVVVVGAILGFRRLAAVARTTRV